MVATLDPIATRAAPWWLDVELTASWAGTYQLDIAALRGFIAGLRTAGATGPIGIYSTVAQWKDITGLTAATTATAFNGQQLPDWVAGTEATLAQARHNCASGGFTGIAPTLAQYRIGPFDADLRCTATHRRARCGNRVVEVRELLRTMLPARVERAHARASFMSGVSR